jgi:Exostosin family
METNTTASAPASRILIVAYRLDTWLLFISRSLSRLAFDVTIITHKATSFDDPDHNDILKHFSTAPFCRLVDFQEISSLPVASYNFAIVGLRGISTPEEKSHLLATIGATPLTAVILRHYNCRFQPMVRLVIKEMMRPFIRRSPRVLVEDYRRAAWLLRLISAPAELGVIPHQRVICQGWPEDLPDLVERPFLFNFLGTHSGALGSEPRAHILDELEALLKISAGGDQQVTLGHKTARIMWHADRPNTTRNRPLNEYLDTLCGSFFTLCLPGHTVITHRVLEALHCGSIPVMPAELVSHYGLPLVHGRNCWLIKKGDWKSVPAALMAIDHAKVLEMQSAAKKLARGEASIPALERKCVQRLGLQPS